jgi:hypothetical protein
LRVYGERPLRSSGSQEASAKSFLQTKASAGGDLGTIAKAALYLMGDTAQKADVQAGVKSSSVFVKVACAAALGIVDKDDASVTSAIRHLRHPAGGEVQRTERDQ